MSVSKAPSAMTSLVLMPPSRGGNSLTSAAFPGIRLEASQSANCVNHCHNLCCKPTAASSYGLDELGFIRWAASFRAPVPC